MSIRNLFSNKLGATGITDGDQLAEIDLITGALIGIEHAHHEIHEGDSFFVTDSATINSAATRKLYLQAPASPYIHLIIGAATSKGSTIALYEDTTDTYASGNALTIFNCDRNRTNASAMTGRVCHTPGAVGNGTLLWIQTVGTNGGVGNRAPVGGSTRADNEIILKASAKYLLVVTSTDDANIIAINLEWYEHTSKTALSFVN